jgi:signal transduction histidine kinase/DNA-binding response OmpR family regulator
VPASGSQRSVVRRWWLNRSVRAKGLIVVAVPLIALIATTTVNMIVQSAERDQRTVGHAANGLIHAAGNVLVDALNAETGVRGYAATHDPAFLGPYRLALAQAGADQRALLKAAAADGDAAGARTVTAAASAVLGDLANLRSAVAAGIGTSALVPALTAGKKKMDALRGQLAALTRRPSATLATRTDALNSLATASEILNVAGLALGLLAGLAGVALFTAGISRRVATAAGNAERLGKGQPLRPAEPSGDDIGRLSCALAKAGTLLDTRAAELTEARDQAIQASQAKNAFLSSTSHELRTPLNSILGFTQLLEMSDLSDEDRDSAQRILAAGRHLLTLINELIDTARIESGDISLSLEPVAIYPLVEEAAQLMSPLAAERAIQISSGCTHPGLAARADRQRLSQVLVNLISNAVKYNRRGGAITITCHDREEGQVTVSVADTGAGLTAADLERIFQPFERLGAAQTSIEGTGIGLPLARSLTEAMRGNLTATSTPGQGSTFTITLPRTNDAADVPPPVTAPAARPRPAGTSGALHVLYIEDNPANVEVVSRFLAHRAHTTLYTAVTGPDGIAYALAHTPDVILLDLHIPGMHGEQVLNELRAQPATAATPIIVLSAEASPGTVRRLLANGAAAYLTKPLNLTELGELLDAHNKPSGGESPAPGAAAAASAGDAPVPVAETAAAQATDQPPGHTVLYIEDDPANLGLMRRALTRRPQTHLLTAQNAQDGIRTATTALPDLILLDNRLPDATGSQVLHQLTSDPATAAIPVVIISGDSGRESVHNFLARGAAAFLPKPFDLGELLATIDNQLSPPAPPG